METGFLLLHQHFYQVSSSCTQCQTYGSILQYEEDNHAFHEIRSDLEVSWCIGAQNDYHFRRSNCQTFPFRTLLSQAICLHIQRSADEMLLRLVFGSTYL